MTPEVKNRDIRGPGLEECDAAMIAKMPSTIVTDWSQECAQPCPHAHNLAQGEPRNAARRTDRLISNQPTDGPISSPGKRLGRGNSASNAQSFLV